LNRFNDFQLTLLSNISVHSASNMRRTSTVLAVTSGKGGVGKSVVAVNLAEMLAAQGHTVALLDADLGQGACAILLNETPARSVLDVARRRALVQDVMLRTSSGITLVQGALEPNPGAEQDARLFEALDAVLAHLKTNCEYVIVDTPAGTEGPVRWALDRADLGLLVVVSEPTAVADAYRLAKLVWKNEPDYPMGVVVNFADSEEEAQGIAERFGHVTEHFTGRVPNFLGWVPFSTQIRQSVHEQTPATRYPGPVHDAFEHLADTLVHGRHAINAAVSL
jgi:flagellar biosynthesis protein FlhG